MLSELSDYAEAKDVDFIILISNTDKYYIRNGFKKINAPNSWLRIDEHRNHGIASEPLDDLFVKKTGSKIRQPGDVDWLGYMF